MTAAIRSQFVVFDLRMRIKFRNEIDAISLIN